MIVESTSISAVILYQSVVSFSDHLKKPSTIERLENVNLFDCEVLLSFKNLLCVCLVFKTLLTFFL